MMTPRDIGSGLVAARKAQDITQRELAARAGVKQPQIARWEATAYGSASLGRVDSVARALGLDIEVLPFPIAAEAPAPYAPSSAPVSDTGTRALARLGVSPDTIAAFCRLHGVRRFALFGSSVRTDFGPGSDVDVLVTWTPGSEPSGIQARLDLQQELRGIFRRNVDLVDRDSVERSENYVRRARILEGARTVHVAR
jgi:predicted nucleotidyltransferase/DNA-binding XRE family transcriptional regulator